MKKSALIIALLVLFAPLTYAEEMPPDVLARIKTKVSAQYPDDFSVQSLLINGEKSSYEFLSTYAPTSVPPDVFARIKANVASQYPDSFSTQKLLIQGQVKSYNELNK